MIYCNYNFDPSFRIFWVPLGFITTNAYSPAATLWPVIYCALLAVVASSPMRPWWSKQRLPFQMNGSDCLWLHRRSTRHWGEVWFLIWLAKRYDGTILYLYLLKVAVFVCLFVCLLACLFVCLFVCLLFTDLFEYTFVICKVPLWSAQEKWVAKFGLDWVQAVTLIFDSWYDWWQKSFTSW